MWLAFAAGTAFGLFLAAVLESLEHVDREEHD